MRLDAQPADLIAQINGTAELTARVTDIADRSNVTGSTVNYIMDYGGSNVSIGTATSGADGNATFTWSVTGFDPGQYVLRMEVADDISTRQRLPQQQDITATFTELNVTVQVPSNIRVDSIPSTITAGVNFQVIGQVEDGDNASRNLTTAVALEMFWFDNPERS